MRSGAACWVLLIGGFGTVGCGDGTSGGVSRASTVSVPTAASSGTSRSAPSRGAGARVTPERVRLEGFRTAPPVKLDSSLQKLLTSDPSIRSAGRVGPTRLMRRSPDARVIGARVANRICVLSQVRFPRSQVNRVCFALASVVEGQAASFTYDCSADPPRLLVVGVAPDGVMRVDLRSASALVDRSDVVGNAFVLRGPATGATRVTMGGDSASTGPVPC